MVIARALLALALVASTARADSPKLADARTAIDEVRYDDAQRLLVAALQDGGNSPAAVREIYKLSASTALVLGQREVGEQYYRRWLAIDPAATLGADVSPKLREPFEAAQAFIAAHGRVTAMVSRAAAGEVEVAVAQPMPMVIAVTVGAERVALSTQGRALVHPAAGATAIALVDDRDNRLVEVALPPAGAVEPAVGTGNVAPVPPPSAPRPGSPLPPSRSKTWLAWGIPAGVLLAVGAGFGSAAWFDGRFVENAIEDSGQHFYTDVVDRQDRRKTFLYIAGGATALGIVLAIPAAYYFFKLPQDQRVIPFVDSGGAGVSLAGSF